MAAEHRSKSEATRPSVDIGELLSKELGAARIIRRESDRIADYARDESNLGAYPPDCAVLCESTEQVATVLRLAAEHEVPVTVGRADGTHPRNRS